MPPSFPAHSKRQSLQASGTLNPRAEKVRHGLFQQEEFFDPQDLVQLKYEALRALRSERCSISKASADFGLSRPTIYQAQMQFEQGGMAGLLPRKRGPRKPHKVTGEVLAYLREVLSREGPVPAGELARRVKQRFQTRIHPRTIEKALRPPEKKGAPETS
ncbi:MAG: helix-turn-helix domain-containing protein [Verrucomicrobiales bacterium]